MSILSEGIIRIIPSIVVAAKGFSSSGAIADASNPTPSGTSSTLFNRVCTSTDAMATRVSWLLSNKALALRHVDSSIGDLDCNRVHATTRLKNNNATAASLGCETFSKMCRTRGRSEEKHSSKMKNAKMEQCNVSA
eukprot:TRINITY_DN581_c0_g1_i1.p3 TRINITY_DN581_c0_g1~~TRINITY_DN581_c0_g1_i1.p3  ORF type:complete len:136 (-),score=13.66 TRINITY_DN581_c0_g1_i1:19-426(-)